jgi:hypothetical protein
VKWGFSFFWCGGSGKKVNGKNKKNCGEILFVVMLRVWLAIRQKERKEAAGDVAAGDVAPHDGRLYPYC